MQRIQGSNGRVSMDDSKRIHSVLNDLEAHCCEDIRLDDTA
ncbi:hypothetical protein [Photobacterium galatheae]|nr:hypothetical protein [Photobacterium galatheae]